MNTKVTAKRLAVDAEEFLAFKRAMGIGYRRAEFVLNSFVRFVGERYGERPVQLQQAVTLWATHSVSCDSCACSGAEATRVHSFPSTQWRRSRSRRSSPTSLVAKRCSR